MAKPRQCPSCDNLIKNFRARLCWECYIKDKKNNPDKYPWRPPTGEGVNHPNWKGGKWLYWRRQVLKRDNFTCKACGLYDREIMDVDHIIPIRKNTKERREIEKINDIQINGIDNLQTLCPNCHKRKSNKEAKFHSGHSKSR